MPLHIHGLSMRTLEQFFDRSTNDEKDYIRLVGTQCYSGGIHEISFNRKNTCSASTTTWGSTSRSWPKINAYGESFLKEIESKSEIVSLFPENVYLEIKKFESSALIPTSLLLILSSFKIPWSTFFIDIPN